MKLIVTAALTAFVACTPMLAEAAGKEISREVPVDDTFIEIPLGGPQPFYIMRVAIFKGDTHFELCGAGVYPNAQVRSQAKRFLRDSNLDSGTKRALKGLDYFSRVPKANRFDGSTAKCRVTNVPNSAKDPDWTFDWSGHTYYY